jgi:hypothetical protein
VLIPLVCSFFNIIIHKKNISSYYGKITDRIDYGDIMNNRDREKAGEVGGLAGLSAGAYAGKKAHRAMYNASSEGIKDEGKKVLEGIKGKITNKQYETVAKSINKKYDTASSLAKKFSKTKAGALALGLTAGGAALGYFGGKEIAK